MTTEQGEWTRLLAWEGCLNARDLGGYTTGEGRETRWGAVVRSDCPAALTEAGRAALAGYGIRAIVDLRLPAELADSPNPFAEPGDHGIVYTNVSFIDPVAGFPPDTLTLAENYLWMLNRFDGFIAEAMAAIARAPEDGAVLIHCAAGKDRTGLISALLLGLVDVPAETIAADYAMTAELLRPRDEEWLENGPGERAEREAMLARFAPTAEVMLEVLEGLGERHGGSSPTCDRPAWTRATWTGCATGCSPARRMGRCVDRQAPAGLHGPRAARQQEHRELGKHPRTAPGRLILQLGGLGQ